jgi:hypothetical protein
VWPWLIFPAIVATVVFAVRAPAVVREYFMTTRSPSKPKATTSRPTGRRDRTTRPPKKVETPHVWVTEPPAGWTERLNSKEEAKHYCPTPDKMFIGTRTTALRKAREKTEQYGDPHRAYPCTCSWWHLTTKEESEYNRF